MQHQHLAVGRTASTDADDRHLDRLGDLRSQIARHAFEQDHRGTGLFQGDGIGTHLPRLGFATALDLVATEEVHRLRRQAHVCTDRYTTLGQQANGFGEPGGALDLDHVGAGLHQLGTVVQGLFDGGIGHEWQVPRLTLAV